ncbi:hypothetical protein Tco_1374032, partial [Tanacetum coccineum]
MDLHVVSYGIDNVARPLLLFFPSENQLLWFRYVVPTGRVKVLAGKYVVPTGKDNVIVNAGRTKVIPA